MDVVLISVIVPVYNASGYLRKCLDSILNQTYSNLEILLVDDGSTDGSSDICDFYSQKDNRVVVIHQENSGAGAARNRALDMARGKYIGFIDSDDCIESLMFETMLKTMIEFNADIVVCGHHEVIGNNYIPKGVDRLTEYSSQDAQIHLLRDITMRSYLWDKLFAAYLFDGLRFPEGKIYEDPSIMYRLFEGATRIVHIPDCFYYYMINEEGVSHVRDSYKKYLNNSVLFNTYKERFYYYKSKENILLQKYSLVPVIPIAYSVIRMAINYNETHMVRTVQKFLLSELVSIMKNPIICKKEKVLWIIYTSKPQVLRLYFKFFTEG